MTNLRVVEIFPAIQGEGPYAGQRVTFLRLAGCNLDCGRGANATWTCDTPYAWDWSKYSRREESGKCSTVRIISDLSDYNTKACVVSGGEPLLQRGGLEELINLTPHIFFDIETNGTRPPLSVPIRRYVASLKLANSGVPIERRIIPSAIEELENTNNVSWKFVVSTPQDIDEIEKLVYQFNLSDVWCMPAGTTAAEVLKTAKRIEPYVLGRRYNLSLRQHILLHDNDRGF